jgi:hypothetical protein
MNAISLLEEARRWSYPDQTRLILINNALVAFRTWAEQNRWPSGSRLSYSMLEQCVSLVRQRNWVAFDATVTIASDFLVATLNGKTVPCEEAPGLPIRG